MINKIAIVGDYHKGSVTHVKLNESLEHIKEKFGYDFDYEWLDSLKVEQNKDGLLKNYCGIWSAPGSPFASLEEVLACKHLEKDGRFYPVGRLASIESLNVLWEKDGAWTKIISLVKKHPSEFFKAWYNNEESRIIDEEDLGRSELRHEVLFFHQVVEEFLDHFLQALYALNNQYFPSRKRTEKSVEGFKLKPENCTTRLESIVILAASEETIPQAVAEIRKIGAELKALWE